MIFKKYKLEDVCLKITDGSHFSPKNDENSSIPMFSVKDMRTYDFDYNNCKHISKKDYEIMIKQDCVPKYDDILVAKDGSYLKEIFINKKEDEKAVLSSIAIFRPNKNIVVPEFLCYLLKSKNVLNYVKANCVSGSALPRIILKSFKNIEIMIPNVIVQKKIVNMLHCIDRKIKLNNNINKNLLNLSNQIYKKYFSNINDFDEIRLGELCNIKYGKGLPTTKILDFGYPVYGGNGIIGYYKEKMYDDSQVLISCRGAASGKVIFSKPNSYITNNSLILECERINYFYVKEWSLENSYYSYTTGSAQPQITIDNIKDIVIKLPKIDQLIKFNNIMKPLEEKYFNNIEECETLEQLRDILLPKLMNGGIDLGNIEI